jgi:hypothetical protein
MSAINTTSPRPNSGIWSAWNDFWFEPINPAKLHFIRLLTGLLLSCWLLSFAFTYHQAIGRGGWLDATAYEALGRLPAEANIPVSWGHRLIPASPALLGVVYLAALINGILFTLGRGTRLTAPLAWLTVIAFTWNPVLYDGANSLLAILLLYLAIGYMGIHFGFNLGSRSAPLSRRGESSQASVFANLALRLIQVHFAIIIFMSLLHKLQDAEWWAGDALWYSIYTPFETNIADLLRQSGQRGGLLTMLSLATYLTLAWQLTYPIQPASKLGRWVMLGGSAIGWIWCDLVAKQPLFGPAILIASLAACRWDED